MVLPVILITVSKMISRLGTATIALLLLYAMTGCTKNEASASAAPAQVAGKAAAADSGVAQPSPSSGTAGHTAEGAYTALFENQHKPILVDGQRALQYTREVVAFGPRYIGSPGHAKTESYLRQELKSDHFEEDTFTTSTPAGSLRMTNFIAKFPGKKNGIIVIAGHYDTIYNQKDFVGANDGGSSTGLLLELARELRGRNIDGYSIWLVWFDGEEAIRHWSDTDSVYGSRHLAAKWAKDGTLKKIQAFLLLDMIGDADLSIERDGLSTPWLLDVIYKAAQNLGYQSHFFARPNEIADDHIPFSKQGVAVADLIDYDYGPQNSYWHTPQDTMDKLSAQSFEIVGSVVLETIRLLNAS